MIQFRNITEENFTAILRMRQAEGQHFVSSNAESLAQAWLYRDHHDVYSFAIYDDETPVGFMQLDEDLENKTMYLWRVMISAEYQGRGLGTAAVEKMISLVKGCGKYGRLELGCKPENAGAMHIYQKLGFRLTGETEHGEAGMRLDLAGPPAERS